MLGLRKIRSLPRPKFSKSPQAWRKCKPAMIKASFDNYKSLIGSVRNLESKAWIKLELICCQVVIKLEALKKLGPFQLKRRNMLNKVVLKIWAVSKVFLCCMNSSRGESSNSCLEKKTEKQAQRANKQTNNIKTIEVEELAAMHFIVTSQA